MNFIVGDIHGEITKLNALLENIINYAKNPQFIFIGDYIDKGENIVATLNRLEALNQEFECNFLIGNHEYLWLQLKDCADPNAEYLMKYGAKSTIESVKAKNLWEARDILINQFSNFFSSLKSCWQDGNYVIVHSGIKPQYYQTPIENIPVYDLLFNRYDFIKHEAYYLDNKKVIFGHTGFYYPYCDEFKIGIDTSACYKKDQPLTCYCPDLDIFINSDKKIYKRSDLQINSCPNIIRVKPWREC
jgi:serine/threonine protein phosphatase 1